MDAASLARQYADLPIPSTQKNVQDAIAAIIYSQTNATVHNVWRLFED